jgi:hypothetical protein
MKVRTNIRAGQGLGDAVADLTHLTGIDQLANAYTQMTGKDCGCEARKKLFNQVIPNLNSPTTWFQN